MGAESSQWQSHAQCRMCPRCCEGAPGLLKLLLGAVCGLLAALGGALQRLQLLLQLQGLLPVLLPAGHHSNSGDKAAEHDWHALDHVH